MPDPDGLERFIPAWAGNSCSADKPFPFASVHPRMGGEQRDRLCHGCGRGGSSPHGRGTGPSGGVSPRKGRFIPAWAGNSQRCIE